MLPALPEATWVAGWAGPSSRPLDSFPLRRAFERFLITYRAVYSEGCLHGLSSGSSFLFPLTGWVVSSGSLCAGLLESPLFALLDTPVFPLVFFFQNLSRGTKDQGTQCV